MRIVIFTGFKPLLSQPWLTNELDIFTKARIKILAFYICRSKYEERQLIIRKYTKHFLYIPKLTFKLDKVLYLAICQIKSIFSGPYKYFSLLIFVISKFNWQYLKNFLKFNEVIYDIKKFNPDIIYSHSAYDQYILAFLANKFFDKKFGLIPHSTYRYPPYVSYIHRKADFIVVKSEYLKKDYLRRYTDISPQKITVLPWGIDTEFFRPIGSFTSEESPSTTLGINWPPSEVSSGFFTILSVSRFVEMKGLIYLLQTCKLLADENIKFKCILVGYGPLKSLYQRFIDRNKLNGYVKIYPPVPHSAKLKKLLASADVFVLPAVIDDKTGEQDFIPNAVLEAMAMEKVVITTKVTGMQEAAKDGESIIFCKEKDPQNLAVKIQIVMKLSEEKKRQIGKMAREVVVKYYDKEKQGKKFVEFLENQL